LEKCQGEYEYSGENHFKRIIYSGEHHSKIIIAEKDMGFE